MAHVLAGGYAPVVVTGMGHDDVLSTLTPIIPALTLQHMWPLLLTQGRHQATTCHTWHHRTGGHWSVRSVNELNS